MFERLDSFLRGPYWHPIMAVMWGAAALLSFLGGSWLAGAIMAVLALWHVYDAL